MEICHKSSLKYIHREKMEALDPLDLMVDRDKREREAHPVALESQESR